MGSKIDMIDLFVIFLKDCNHNIISYVLFIGMSARNSSLTRSLMVMCIIFNSEGVADKLAKYFSGHLAALWHTFGCNFMGSMHLKLLDKVSRHLVVFSVGRVTSKTKTFNKNRKINDTSCMPIYIMSLLSESVTQTAVITNM